MAAAGDIIFGVDGAQLLYVRRKPLSKEREPLSDLAKITEGISAIYIKSNFILTTNQSWGDK